MLGYGSHGLLDACTSYGTHLLWPFDNVRVAWNTISVIDPVFTMVMAILLFTAVFRGSRAFLYGTFGWAVFYLGAGWVQQERAVVEARVLAESRAHYPAKIVAKPTFGNIVVWKVIYEYEDVYYIDAVRPGLFASRVWEGGSIEKLDLDTQFGWLPRDSQQGKDVERFRVFSSGYLAVDQRSPNRIVDIRYSLLPQNITALWGLALNEHATYDEHVEYFVNRQSRDNAFSSLFEMIVDGDNAD